MRILLLLHGRANRIMSSSMGRSGQLEEQFREFEKKW
jgi:hypothetical protein